MKALYDKFISLDAEARKNAHIKACSYSLSVWDKFVQDGNSLSYRDSVMLMKHQLEEDLPNNALQAIIDNVSSKEISELYLEPIAALQDMDWEPPEHIGYAYYSIYNAYRKYCEGSDIDDWLIINQSLSSEPKEESWDAFFKSILS